ncbi:LPXTG cell wall anchor domain-containing protein [Streptococcus pluranimalium]
MSKTSKQSLPRTGEKQQSGLLAGLGLLMTASVLAKRKKREESSDLE